MSERQILHVGLVDFSEPTLLLISDAPGFRWLADQLENRIQFTVSQARGPEESRVTISFLPTKIGRLSRAGNAFNWSLSAAESTQFASQLRQLSASATPAHTYLDANDDIQVMASLDEYDPQEVFSS